MSEERTETSPPEAQTSDSTHDKGGSLWILWTFMALLLAYPLSIGPVALAYKNDTPPNFVHVVYWPLAYLTTHSAMANRAIFWYIQLWDGR
jgi:hypothetical protein